MEGFFTKKETESLSRPNGRSLTCTSCGLYKNCNTPKMKPFGNFAKGIMNIGEAPNAADDQRGVQWQGKAGQKLKQAYKKLGIDLFEDCINLNAINCFPSSGKVPSDKIDNCRRIVLSAIKEYKPKVIVLFGSSAVYSVLKPRWNDDIGDINKWRGWTIPDQEYQAWIIPVFDPTLVERFNKPEMDLIWEQDLAKVKGKLKVTFPIPKEPEIEIIETLEPLNNIKSGLIAFDYETTGLKPHEKGHKIVCVSVADSPDHVYVGMVPNSTAGREPLKNLLKNWGVQKMAHNMKFEDTWTAIRLKTEVVNWKWDSMLAAHILDNREKITGLKFQSYVMFGVPDYSSEVSPYLKAVDDKNANSLNRIYELLDRPGGKEKLLTYCGLDSIYEYRLALLQRYILNPLPF